MITNKELQLINSLLEKGKNVLISYQESKKQLHIKTQEVKRIK